MLNFLTIFFKTSLITAKNIVTKKMCAIIWPPDIYTNMPEQFDVTRVIPFLEKLDLVMLLSVGGAFLMLILVVAALVFVMWVYHKEHSENMRFINVRWSLLYTKAFVYNSVAIFLTPGQMFTLYNIHRQCRLHQIIVWWNIVGNKNTPSAYA